MLSWVVIIRSTLGRRSLLPSPKSLPLNSFADPHPLTPVPSILYKKHGGRGTKPLRRSDVYSLHPEGGHGTQFASGTDLSPLKCAVAAKHRVLPVFSRNRLTSSLLESTLMSTIVSVDSKWFTGMLTLLAATLTKNRGVAQVAAFSVTFRRSDVQTFRRSAASPIAVQPLWCHNPQRRQVSLRSGETSRL